VDPSPKGERVAVREPNGPGGIRLSLLDGFELCCDDRVVSLPLGSQRLVAFLALHDRALTRLYVAGALWLDASEGRSRANLRSALWRVGQPGAPIVEASATHLRLGREVVVDLTSLVTAARDRLAERTAAAGDVDAASLSGDLLPDWYDDWVLTERERVSELRLHALEALAERLTESGSYGRAVEAAMAAVRAEPLRESAQRALIRVHLAEGNRCEALRRYRTYRARLWDELGLEPSPQMEELVDGIADALAPGEAARPAPLRA
jgi:DNA-binding SARP family transcriptional activator